MEKTLSGGLSSRQLCVSLVVAGLSPAAAVAGTVQWPWLALWSGVAVGAAWIALRYSGQRLVLDRFLKGLYGIWGVLLAARVLERAARRIDRASVNGIKPWLIVLLGAVLICIGCGKTEAFFRMVEIFWLSVGAVLVLVLTVGLFRAQWKWVLPPVADWTPSLWAAGEIFGVAIFLIPYIYKVERTQRTRSVAWLAVLGGLSILFNLVTLGLLGSSAGALSHPFFVATGLLGRSSRCEGLLSVLWLLPDLTLAGLLCRVWPGRWPVFASGAAAALALLGAGAGMSEKFCAIVSVGLWALTLLYPLNKRKIVPDFS